MDSYRAIVPIKPLLSASNHPFMPFPGVLGQGLCKPHLCPAGRSVLGSAWWAPRGGCQAERGTRDCSLWASGLVLSHHLSSISLPQPWQFLPGAVPGHGVLFLSHLQNQSHHKIKQNLQRHQPQLPMSCLQGSECQLPGVSSLRSSLSKSNLFTCLSPESWGQYLLPAIAIHVICQCSHFTLLITS